MNKYIITLTGHPFLLKAGMATTGQTLLIEAAESSTAKTIQSELSQVEHAIYAVRKATKKDERHHAETLTFPGQMVAIKEKIIAAYADFNAQTAYTITGVIIDCARDNNQAGFTFAHEESGATLGRLAQWVGSLRGYEPEHFAVVVKGDKVSSTLEASYKDLPVLSYSVMPVPPLEVTFEMMRESFFGQMTDGLTDRASGNRQ
ncbi:hypothetical protein YA0089_26875 [Pseudomonas viridiflava]|uniref:hypothetical protein n=1 Tax=Pseudomonas viridiflava TaxID=33069 RepID=UPI0018E5DC59|nr:hypothetical protein [Pseudomonas viridiflava]MBI6727243.1 hypothetical protein [Pseudomonas viridiflava]